MKNTSKSSPRSSDQTRGLGIASLILGLLSIVLTAFFGAVLGVIAVIFGILAVRRKAGRGLGIAGIASGSVGIILGLVYLTVLLSLPMLQRSQADTQRRSDAGHLMSAVTQYQTDNNGDLPSADTINDVVSSYIEDQNGSFTDPSGIMYSFVGSVPQTLGQMDYATGVTCDGAGTGFTKAGDKSAAVMVKLTTGVYCTSN